MSSVSAGLGLARMIHEHVLLEAQHVVPVQRFEFLVELLLSESAITEQCDGRFFERIFSGILPHEAFKVP